jgi:hypothetical protein
VREYSRRLLEEHCKNRNGATLQNVILRTALEIQVALEARLLGLGGPSPSPFLETVSTIRPTFQNYFARIRSAGRPLITGRPRERPQRAHVSPGLSFVLSKTLANRLGAGRSLCSAIIRSNAPRAQSWYVCIRSTIVCVPHMRSEHSDADLVPVWRRSNQLFENACMLFKNFQAVRQKVPSIALVAAGRLRIFDFYSGFAAGAFGFLIFSHAFDGPDLYGAFRFVV